MKTLKFVKGPGYLYDLFFLFTLYFNQDEVLPQTINRYKTVEDTEHFNRLLDSVKTVPEELRLFFHLKDNKRCLMTSLYYRSHIDDIFFGSGVSKIQEELQDYNKVLKNVLTYYFGEEAVRVSPEDPDFVRTIGKQIRDSQYDIALKNSLYTFFLEPIPVIQVLQNELTKKEIMLSQMYLDSDSTLTKIQNQIDIDQLAKKIFQIGTTSMDFSSFDELIISFCVANKNSIGVFYQKNFALFLLGTDYEDFTDYLNTKELVPSLAQFGVALAEENRIQMLEMILEKGEVTVAEVKQKMNLSHTNTYYHITLLANANLLSTRNQGRTVYYSINHDYFKDICTALSKFRKDEGEIT